MTKIRLIPILRGQWISMNTWHLKDDKRVDPKNTEKREYRY